MFPVSVLIGSLLTHLSSSINDWIKYSMSEINVYSFESAMIYVYNRASPRVDIWYKYENSYGSHMAVSTPS